MGMAVLSVVAVGGWGRVNMCVKKGDAAASMHRWTLNSESSLETRIRSASGASKL